MKTLIFLVIKFLSSFNTNAQNYTGDEILGNWISPEKDVIINCYKLNNQYYGKVVWFKKYYDDKHGQNPAVPEDQWINNVVMKHFVFKDNEWKSGEIVDLNSGKSYSSFIELDAANTLKCTGYIWLSIFGETIDFTKFTETQLPEFK